MSQPITTLQPTHPGQCHHRWRPRELSNAAGEEGYREECGACGARCTRDKDGKIVSYDRRVVGAAELRGVRHAA